MGLFKKKEKEEEKSEGFDIKKVIHSLSDTELLRLLVLMVYEEHVKPVTEDEEDLVRSVRE